MLCRMTQAISGWAQSLPDKAGWYWYRESGDAQGCMPWIDRIGGPIVVQIELEGGGLFVWVTHMDYTDPLTDENFPGEWCGPIAPPQE